MREGITDSFWVLKGEGRKKFFYPGGLHSLVARELILKYSKRGDLVLDVFCGGGTVVFEALKLERMVVGMDINRKAVYLVNKEVKRMFWGKRKKGLVYEGDSRLKKSYIKGKRFWEKEGRKKVDLVFLHPPYWDVIKYTEEKGDLSGVKKRENFYKGLEEVIEEVLRFLKKEGKAVLVIGDVRRKGEVEMVGFKTANIFLKKGLKLKATAVKNVGDTKGRKGRKGVLKYRARRGGYYNLNHEYIFVFEKSN